MGLRSMEPILGIIDDTDAPEGKRVVVVYGNPAHPMVEYVSASTRPVALRGKLSGVPRLFTNLRDFGVEPGFTPDGNLHFVQTRVSEARYPDGLPRPWQDRGGTAIKVRSQIAGYVIKAVKALRAEAANRAEAA